MQELGETQNYRCQWRGKQLDLTGLEISRQVKNGGLSVSCLVSVDGGWDTLEGAFKQFAVKQPEDPIPSAQHHSRRPASLPVQPFPSSSPVAPPPPSDQPAAQNQEIAPPPGSLQDYQMNKAEPTWWWQPMRKYADFSGRARLKEFWGFALFLLLAGFAAFWLDFYFLPSYTSNSGYISALLLIVTFLPSLAVSARRLHDANISALWLLLYLLGIGPLILFFMWLQPGTKGSNQYGEDPCEGYI